MGELAQVLGQSQPRVSRHVGILCDAGLAERRREGSWVFLRSTSDAEDSPALVAAFEQLLAAAEKEDAVLPFEALYEVERQDIPMLDIRDSL